MKGAFATQGKSIHFLSGLIMAHWPMPFLSGLPLFQFTYPNACPLNRVHFPTTFVFVMPIHVAAFGIEFHRMSLVFLLQDGAIVLASLERFRPSGGASISFVPIAICSGFVSGRRRQVSFGHGWEECLNVLGTQSCVMRSSKPND